MQHTRLHAEQQLKRHLRSPFIWVLAIAGPLAARYLVPETDATYAIIGVNDAVLRKTASVIGLELGVIAAVILTPLAYIFLRAGRTRIQPWQVTDVVPRRRSALSLGRWVGDVLALWMLLTGLAVSGVVLSFFRLSLNDVAPFETMASALIIAAPVLAVVAAIRAFFAMRPRLRGALGDVAFFVLWMTALVMSSAYFMEGEAASPMIDVFGFSAPLATGTGEPVTALFIGGAPGTDRVMDFDAMAGVTQPDYLLSRLIWLLIAILLAACAGFALGPNRVKASKQGAVTGSEAAVFSGAKIVPVKPISFALMSRAFSLVTEIFRPRWIVAPLLAIALAGGVFPLRGAVGPALVLLLIFPLTRYGSRWRPKSLVQWKTAFPGSLLQDQAIRFAGVVVAIGVLLLPSIITMTSNEWWDVVAIGLGLPLIALTLGFLTRNAVAGRLVLLILWYGYLNLPPVQPF